MGGNKKMGYTLKIVRTKSSVNGIDFLKRCKRVLDRKGMIFYFAIWQIGVIYLMTFIPMLN